MKVKLKRPWPTNIAGFGGALTRGVYTRSHPDWYGFNYTVFVKPLQEEGYTEVEYTRSSITPRRYFSTVDLERVPKSLQEQVRTDVERLLSELQFDKYFYEGE